MISQNTTEACIFILFQFDELLARATYELVGKESGSILVRQPALCKKEQTLERDGE